MGYQRNLRIHSGNVLLCSFDAPWCEWSWINLFKKETQNPFLDSLGFKNSILDFLKETHPSRSSYHSYKSCSRNKAWKLILRQLNQNRWFRIETNQSTKCQSFLRSLQYFAFCWVFNFVLLKYCCYIFSSHVRFCVIGLLFSMWPGSNSHKVWLRTAILISLKASYTCLLVTNCMISSCSFLD